ncbi:hypothetical protein [Massilia genomosp. 1]|uniref:Uncharacterized protein n=1 Tax=Massilia genomosp. 1 TaxID=2609280 RepID=A0ABX0MNZ3_9BURK|nr:hypothetical protein [Massilia genomosp. 1]NHZ64499.1 hypothetical protein [Massilia genomosp. 1]
MDLDDGDPVKIKMAAWDITWLDDLKRRQEGGRWTAKQEESSIRANMADRFLSRPVAPTWTSAPPIARPADQPPRVAEQPIQEGASMDTAVTYYQRIPLSRDKPSVVYKFYSDTARAPERYSPPDGWVPDKNLYLRLMSGVIDASDIVSEREALQIMKDLDGEY